MFIYEFVRNKDELLKILSSLGLYSPNGTSTVRLYDLVICYFDVETVFFSDFRINLQHFATTLTVDFSE